MTRLFCVGIAVAAVLFAVPALASVPFPDNCIVDFTGGLDAQGIMVVCPKGDPTGGFDMLDVTVKDQFNLPISGQLVTVTWSNTTTLCSAVISGTTNASGYVQLALKVGTNNPVALAPRITTNYTVMCMGTTIKTGSRTVMSPDLDCSPIVGGLDFALFALEYNKVGVGLKCDYNNDGKVDALDFAIFALHWLHT